MGPVAHGGGGGACCRALLEGVEDVLRGPAPHVVPVVLAPLVVAHEPGVGLGLQLADRDEAPAVEGRAPALPEDGAVEALAYRGPRAHSKMPGEGPEGVDLLPDVLVRELSAHLHCPRWQISRVIPAQG